MPQNEIDRFFRPVNPEMGISDNELLFFRIHFTCCFYLLDHKATRKLYIAKIFSVFFFNKTTDLFPQQSYRHPGNFTVSNGIILHSA